MGFFDFLSGSDTPKTRTLDYGPIGRYWTSAIGKSVAGGLSGQGMLPVSTEERLQNEVLRSYSDAYKSSRSELDSRISRFIPGRDSKVRNFLRADLANSFAKATLAAKEGFKQQKELDKNTAFQIGSNMLNAGKSDAIANTGMANRTAAQMYENTMQYGSPLENFAYGAGQLGYGITQAWPGASQSQFRTIGQSNQIPTIIDDTAVQYFNGFGSAPA